MHKHTSIVTLAIAAGLGLAALAPASAGALGGGGAGIGGGAGTGHSSMQAPSSNHIARAPATDLSSKRAKLPSEVHIPKLPSAGGEKHPPITELPKLPRIAKDGGSHLPLPSHLPAESGKGGIHLPTTEAARYSPILFSGTFQVRSVGPAPGRARESTNARIRRPATSTSARVLTIPAEESAKSGTIRFPGRRSEHAGLNWLAL